MSIIDATTAVLELVAMPTSKNIVDTRLLGFISTAWLMLLAETICRRCHTISASWWQVC
ncbi:MULTISPECIES: hypothetical protein [Rhodococcus]|uniref:hypothetical protein n=1 Tax=Rhodococcus TaxID=1827 RepID=UPI0012D347D1|nr:hypothetical protein [Rhodococcus erythropolis]MCJ0897569.1 hypothetical protein [Rhodococcus sp. ARC_M13]